MAQVINTNIASLNAQRNLNSSQAGTNQALERLSSGLRINSAKDDAAGLAISTRFESQIKGLNVAIRNAGDGVSLAQTAEGSLGSMTESLQRIRELALQASNGTNSSADREAMNAEAQLLIEEVSRVSEGANFNGVNLLDGSLSTSFQVGANAGESIGISIGKLTTDTLGVSAANGVSATGSDNALSNGDLVINGTTVGASRASDDTASTNNAAASAISKAAAINRVSDQSGVTAVVDTNVAAGSTMSAGAASGTVTVNGTQISIDTTGDAASSRSAVVTAINAQSALTGVSAVDSGDDALGVSLVAADGRNIELSYGGDLSAANTGLAAAGTNTGSVTLVANSDTNEINIAGANTANAGVAAGTYTAGVSTVSSTARNATAGTQAQVSFNSVDLNAFAGKDFSQLAQAGVAASVTGEAVAAGNFDFSGAAPEAGTVAGNVDVRAYDSTDMAFADITGGTAGALEGATDFNGAVPGGLNLSGYQFSITYGGDTTNVALDGDYTGDNAALLADINTQLDGSGVVAAYVDDGAGGGQAYLEFSEVRNEGGNIVFDSLGTGSDTLIGLTDADSSDAEGTAADAGTANEITFTVDVDNTGAQNVTLDQNYATAADMVNAINTQLTGATASVDSTTGFLTITSEATGLASEIETADVAGTYFATQTGLGNTVDNGTDSNNITFSVSNGTTSSTIELNSDYTADAAGAVSAIQAQLDADNMGITVAIDEAGGNFTLSFTETTNPPADQPEGIDITVTDEGTGGFTALTDVLGAAPTTVAGEQYFAEDQNATFTITVDGTEQQFDLNQNIADLNGLLTAINDGLTGAEATVNGSGDLLITSMTTGSTSTVSVSDLGGTAGGTAASVLGLAEASNTGVDGANGVETLAAGDLVINGVTIGAASASDDNASYDAAFASNKEASGISMAAAINRATDSTGVTATVNATEIVGAPSTAGVAGETGVMTLNGVEINLTVQADADANRAQAASQINAVSGQTGVVAEDNGSGLTLTAADGRNVSIAFDTNGGAAAENFGLGGTAVGEADFTAAGTSAEYAAVTTYSTVSLSSAGSIDVKGGTNGNAGLEGQGLSQGSFGGAVSGQFLNEVDISTQKGATDALAAVDNALNSVNGARADLGAVQNRFEATISNLAVNSENLSAANSRIRDADFASEAANLARSQVLQQAGISILSQANASGQQVLALLQ